MKKNFKGKISMDLNKKKKRFSKKENNLNKNEFNHNLNHEEEKKENNKNSLNKNNFKEKSNNNNNNNNNLNINELSDKLSSGSIFFREKEKTEIDKFLKEQNSNILYVAGQPGTGKTSLLLDLFKDEENKNNILYIYINCLYLFNEEDFYKKIFQSLNDINFYNKFQKQFENKKYNEIISLLETKIYNKNIFLKLFEKIRKFLMIFLFDEIDVFYTKNNEFNFFEIMYLPNMKNINIKFILISNNIDFSNEIINKLNNRNLNLKKIIFAPYTHTELFNIISKKLEEINMQNYFAKDAIKFLSINYQGDIRPLIETIKNFLLNKNKNNKIELIDMLTILKKKNITLSNIIKTMTIEQKIILASIYQLIKNNKKSDFDLKNLYDSYKKIKNETNNTLLSLNEFREVLLNFKEMGIINVSNSKKSLKENNYKVKFSEDELSMIMAEPDIFKLFKTDDYLE